MGNTSASTSKSGVYKSGFLLFPHSNRFHPVSFSWILGIAVLVMTFFWHCRFLWIFKNACHAHAWLWILWERHPSLPFSSGALTPGEGPLFQNKHSFYTPSPLSWKRRAMLPSSLLFYGAFSLNVFLFHLGGHYPSVNLIHTLVITSNVISTPSWCQIPRGIVNLFVLLLNL